MTGTFRRWAAGILAALVTVLGPGRGLQAAAAEIPETNFAGEEKAVYLDIDSRYAYEGMEQSFSEGYRPEVKDGRLYLVIPFIANGDLAADRLTVSLGFPEPGTSPFLLKNYQKMVEKKQYVLKNGKMTCLETAGEVITASAGGT